MSTVAVPDALIETLEPRATSAQLMLLAALYERQTGREPSADLSARWAGLSAVDAAVEVSWWWGGRA